MYDDDYWWNQRVADAIFAQEEEENKMTYSDWLKQEIKAKLMQIEGVTKGNHPDKDKILNWLNEAMWELEMKLAELS
jgi:hypothetical protein